jgi:hypothetical protein
MIYEFCTDIKLLKNDKAAVYSGFVVLVPVIYSKFAGVIPPLKSTKQK